MATITTQPWLHCRRHLHPPLMATPRTGSYPSRWKRTPSISDQPQTSRLPTSPQTTWWRPHAPTVRLSSGQTTTSLHHQGQLNALYKNACIEPGFFLTSTAEKTKTQGQNSSKKLREKTQPLRSTLLKFVKLKKNSSFGQIFRVTPKYAIFITKYFQ